MEILGMCRGDGKGYIKLGIGAVPNAAVLELQVSTDGGSELPGDLRGIDGEKATPDMAEVIAVVALLDIERYKLVLTWRDTSGSMILSETVSVSSEELKWRSRIAYRIHPQLASEIRDVEIRSDSARRMAIELIGCIPDGDRGAQSTTMLVRWRLVAPSTLFADGSEPDIRFVGTDGVLRQASLFRMSRTSLAGFQAGLTESVYSMRMEISSVPGFIWVRDAGDRVPTAFVELPQELVDCFLADFYWHVHDAADDAGYRDWLKAHRATSAVLAHERELESASNPEICVMVACDKIAQSHPGYLHATIESIFSQTYRHWSIAVACSEIDPAYFYSELAQFDIGRIAIVGTVASESKACHMLSCAKETKADAVMCLSAGDTLEPDALFAFVAAFHDGQVDAVYCDEDRLLEDGNLAHPQFKPAFDQDYLYSGNYIGRCIAVRMRTLGKMAESMGMASVDRDDFSRYAYDFQLLLQLVERNACVRHVGRILLHAVAEEVSRSRRWDAERIALERHLVKRGIAANVELGDTPLTYKVSYQLEEQPKVSIIIPNKDHIDDLLPCVNSLLNRCTYRNYEIVIIENNSVEEQTFRCYEELQSHERVRIERYEGVFNFSKIVNFGAAHTDGDYLLLLNNDTEVIAPDFLETMVGSALREDVGIVGAKLFHFDGTIQHAGVIVWRRCEPWHQFLDYPGEWKGYGGRAVRPQEMLAVTGACQLVKRSVFEEVDGYDEEFAVGLNDVDFCLRVHERGYRILFSPEAQLYHREFTSRGYDVTDERLIRQLEEMSRLRLRWAQYFVKGDPFYSRSFNYDDFWYAL